MGQRTLNPSYLLAAPIIWRLQKVHLHPPQQAGLSSWERRQGWGTVTDSPERS